MGSGKYIVSYCEDNTLCKKEFDSFEEIVDFLHSVGYTVSDIQYKFPDQLKEFTENVAMCGMPRGYRKDSNLIVDDKPIFGPDITIEEVMGGFAPIYCKENQ
jgi:hypothetical protein